MTFLLRRLDYGTNVTRQIVHLMDDTGCDMISSGDSPAGPDLISPDLYALLALFADTPRFNLNTGCALPRGTPPENILAVIRTARQFG